MIHYLSSTFSNFFYTISLDNRIYIVYIADTMNREETMNTEREKIKALAQQLDRCAVRAETVGANPATERQCWYLATLMITDGDEGDRFYTDTGFVLSKGKASELIAFYKDLTEGRLVPNA